MINIHLAPPRSWKYHLQNNNRDDRIDFLKGLTILVVVINHILTPSLFYIITIEAIGAISSAECFVFLSGYLIGFIYQKQIETKGLKPVVFKLLKRASQIYLAALVTNVIVYLLQYLPFINSTVLTSYTDVKTGIVYSLYGNGSSIITTLKGIIFLTYGPYQINILGLYVVMVAITPLILVLMKYRRTWLVILGSFLVYAVGSYKRAHIMPMQSESAFPILLWQLLFVQAAVIGYHKTLIKKLFVGSRGKLIVVFSIFLFLIFAFFALNNPWYKIPLNLRFNFIPEQTFLWIYDHFFQRSILGIGRFINTLLVVSVMFYVLNYFWVPINWFTGWFFIPLGRATLYVFIVHVIFVLLIANIHPFYGEHLLSNTIAHTLVVMMIWFMVSKRMLFNLIPR